MVLAFGCADPDLAPIVTFDSAGKGAYPRLLSQTDKLINLFDVSGSQYSYGVEFVDPERGGLVSEYALEMTYEGADGTVVGPVAFRSWSSSEFTTSANGYQAVDGITITANEAFTAAGVKEEDVQAGSEFIFEGKVITTEGQVFTASNSSATVRGSAFQGHFNFTLPAACPSSLAGTYTVEGSNFWCGAADATGTVTIQAEGGGVYTFDDWSLGAYPACYGGLAASWGSLTFTDVCNEVSFTGFTDAYGDTWEFTSTVNGGDWTIDWVNTYGEAGSAVIKANSGDWPFTLK